MVPFAKIVPAKTPLMKPELEATVVVVTALAFHITSSLFALLDCVALTRPFSDPAGPGRLDAGDERTPPVITSQLVGARTVG
jgi:hypothetical protein